MRIPAWRLALTGGAIVILTALGVGLVAAAAGAPAPATDGINAAPAASGGTSTAAGALANHPALRRLLKRLENRPGLGRLVDGQLTYTDKNGQLVTIELDHGTIASIGSGVLTIDEAGGRQVTVSTDSNTVVRLGDGSGTGTLGDLKMGDQVYVQSRVTGGAVLAKHILRIPPAADDGSPASPAPSA